MLFVRKNPGKNLKFNKCHNWPAFKANPNTNGILTTAFFDIFFPPYIDLFVNKFSQLIDGGAVFCQNMIERNIL